MRDPGANNGCGQGTPTRNLNIITSRGHIIGPQKTKKTLEYILKIVRLRISTSPKKLEGRGSENPGYLTYIKKHSATAVHPADDNIRADHASVRGESKAHPARGPHSNCERACLCHRIKGPVDLVHRFAGVVIAENGAERIGRQVDVSGLKKRKDRQE